MAPVSEHAQPRLAEPTNAELAVADELGNQLIRFMRLVTRMKAQLTKQGPDGIERAAYAILSCLIHEGPQRTGRLADTLHSDISTISRQSSSLVQHGLIERKADPVDGRACLLAPTEEGQRVFAENRKARSRWLATMLAEWPEEDRTTLNTLFDRLNTSIENIEPQLADAAAHGHGKGENA
ncbi:MarR family transcriptional regulator [Saccharomonospora sp. NPDC046836]|uniref:MarR family winged helix-turn-helix transcriptional regulator n=1 Tax=Saccharomonospora sp. NPDC046836 TaxID=3156921 RepID=UPI0033E9B3FF